MSLLYISYIRNDQIRSLLRNQLSNKLCVRCISYRKLIESRILTSNVDLCDFHVIETNFPSWRRKENEREAIHIMNPLSRLVDMLRDPRFIAFKASATSIKGYEEYPYRTTRSPQRYTELTI